MTLQERLEQEEGFRDKVYYDTEDVPTFGHGFTFITEDESKMVLKMKIAKLQYRLHNEINHLSQTRQDAIVEIAYNVGLAGCRKFKRMWAAIEKDDFETAALEVLDSNAARLLPRRYRSIAERIKNG